MSKACVFLADGFEEIEGLTVVDVLRRAGVETVTVSVMNGKLVKGSHGIGVEADGLFDEVQMDDADLIVLPGGMPGTINLKNHEGLRKLVLKFFNKGKYVAAICAAPTILSELGILAERKACCYPSFEGELKCGEILQVPVTVDGCIVTGRGMGAAIPFALQLTSMLCGEEKAEEIRKSIVYTV